MLNGSIPDCLWKLTSLTSLDVSGNRFSGSIPASLPNIPNLVSLNLSSNAFSNNIPNSIGDYARNLLSLDLSGNRLTGTLPSSFGSLYLMHFNARGNSLTGDVYSVANMLWSCDYLDLSNNALNDTVPEALIAKFGRKSFLQETSELNSNNGVNSGVATTTEVTSSDNVVQTSTTIQATINPDCLIVQSAFPPVDFGFNCNNATLVEFETTMNRRRRRRGVSTSYSRIIKLILVNMNLAGSLPPSLGNLAALQTLDLSGNQLTGTVPDSFSKLQALTVLSLNNNLITGPLPSALQTILKNNHAVVIVDATVQIHIQPNYNLIIECENMDPASKFEQIYQKQLEAGIDLAGWLEKTSGNPVANEYHDAAYRHYVAMRRKLALEHMYAKGLEQLSRRALSVPNNQLGGFAEVWNKVLVSTAEEAQLHQGFAIGLSDKVVSLSIHEVDLGKLLKEYENEVKGFKKDGKGAIGFLKNLKAKKAEELSPEIAGAMDTANKSFTEKATPLLLKFEQMDRSRKYHLNSTLSRFCELFANMVKPVVDIPDRILAACLGFDVETDKEFFSAILAGGGNSGYDSPVALNNRATGLQQAETGSSSAAAVPVQPSAPAPLVDEEGFTIVPRNNALPTWDSPKKVDGFDSSDNEDSEPGAEAVKMKVAIATDVIQDANPSDALNTVKSLAAALPISKRKTQNRQTMGPGSINVEPISVPVSPTSAPIPGQSIPLTAQPSYKINSIAAFGSAPVSTPTTIKPIVKVHGTVVETVNVLIRDGSIEKLLLTGEISVTLPQYHSLPGNSKFKLSIHGTDAFEKFVANETFATIYTGGPAGNGLEVDLSKLASLAGVGATTQLAKYQVHVADDDVDFYAPVLANPVWKCDQSTASLLLAYEYNNDLISKLNVGDVRILSTLGDGGDLKSAQMKPEGSFSQVRRSILWDIGSLNSSSDGLATPNSDDPLKLIARIETSTQATPGTVAIQFKSVGGLLSGIDIDVSDENVVLNDVTKSVVSGKYVCFP
ncbi:UNVERIFIED_CONTAM: hypothetical protein HDU68_006773 [Siphonaria sp. JEL0065]|nr:hypothetical protein HDU68_006773 [Siphonaria sp. JEL0065]